MVCAKDDVTIMSVFDEAQVNCVKHRKCFDQLRKIQASTAANEFLDELVACVACVLPTFKREPAAERVIDFLVQFVTSADGDTDAVQRDELVNALCLRMLNFSASADRAVRFRVTQLVGLMMNLLPEEAEVSDDLFIAVEEAMLQRCRDKVPIVRAWAIRALFRLQDPSSHTDVITGELLRLMGQDASKEVRMAAISTVAPSKHAIRAILARTRDVSADVRLHAMKQLASKVEMRWLAIAQRTQLLSTGLADRQPAVREMCQEMVFGWLRKLEAGNPSALVEALDAQLNEAVAQKVLQLLLERPESRDAVVAAAGGWESLAPAPVLCLRVAIEWFEANARNDERDELIPELANFCETLTVAAATAGDAAPVRADGNFALFQLLRLCPVLDMADEHGRSQLEGLLCARLKSLATAEDLIEPLVTALGFACAGDLSRQQRLLLELMAEIEEPLETEGGTYETEAATERLCREQQCMLARARLGEISAEVCLRVAEEDFDAAAMLKREAAVLHSELEQLEVDLGGTPEEESAARAWRSMRLAELLLQSTTVALRQHETASLPERFLPFVQSPRPDLRALALRCLGLYCLADAAQAAKLCPLFIKAIQHDQPHVQMSALDSYADLLLRHTPAVLIAAAEPPPPMPATAAPLAPLEDDRASSTFSLVLPLLRRPADRLRASAALAACKLLHSGRLLSSVLTARLLILYFIPNEADTQSDDATEQPASAIGESTLECKQLLSQPQQFLSVFFAAAAAMGRLAPALLPAIRVVLSASPGSAEAAVPLDTLIDFVLALTRPETDVNIGRDFRHTHVELGLSLCCEVPKRVSPLLRTPINVTPQHHRQTPNAVGLPTQINPHCPMRRPFPLRKTRRASFCPSTSPRSICLRARASMRRVSGFCQSCLHASLHKSRTRQRSGTSISLRFAWSRRSPAPALSLRPSQRERALLRRPSTRLTRPSQLTSMKIWRSYWLPTKVCARRTNRRLQRVSKRGHVPKKRRRPQTTAVPTRPRRR